MTANKKFTCVIDVTSRAQDFIYSDQILLFKKIRHEVAVTQISQQIFSNSIQLFQKFLIFNFISDLLWNQEDLFNL